jgi:hypothetical protein
MKRIGKSLLAAVAMLLFGVAIVLMILGAALDRVGYRVAGLCDWISPESGRQLHDERKADL